MDFANGEIWSAATAYRLRCRTGARQWRAVLAGEFGSSPGCDKQPPKPCAVANQAEALEQDFAVGEIR